LDEILITDASGRLLNAKVEVGDGEIVLHSRSGAGRTERNPDYRRALEIMLKRLQSEQIKPEVILDSAPAKKDRPDPDDRRLALPSDLTGEVVEQASFLIRRSNEGSSSHGAWRRLLLRVSNLPAYALRSIIDGTVEARGAVMPSALLESVERRHLDAAIKELREGSERPTRFQDATGYVLLPADGGAPLPPKKVFGLALAEALQTHVTPGDFSSGEGIFSLMRQRGLDVVPLITTPIESGKTQKRPNKDQVDEAIVGLPITEEERSWIEGDLKAVYHLRRERSGGLPKAFKSQFRASKGKLFCERCDRDFLDEYGIGIADACFEVHHKMPVSEMADGHETTVDQLELLCANCHRATHREMARV